MVELRLSLIFFGVHIVSPRPVGETMDADWAETAGYCCDVIPSERSESRDLACGPRGQLRAHHSRSLDCADAPLGMAPEISGRFRPIRVHRRSLGRGATMLDAARISG